ncbi:MAG: Lrp/AsnC ligand binding domain-containing protein [Dongiaceae bacterium]
MSPSRFRSVERDAGDDQRDAGPFRDARDLSQHDDADDGRSRRHRITGEDCLLLRLHLRSLEELDGLLDRFLAYGQTTTSIVQSSPVPRRGLPLPDTT